MPNILKNIRKNQKKTNRRKAAGAGRSEENDERCEAVASIIRRNSDVIKNIRNIACFDITLFSSNSACEYAPKGICFGIFGSYVKEYNILIIHKFKKNG